MLRLWDSIHCSTLQFTTENILCCFFLHVARRSLNYILGGKKKKENLSHLKINEIQQTHTVE